MTAILCTLALGLLGALGQIVVHDIIPTFFTAEGMPHADGGREETPPAAMADQGRGGLFSGIFLFVFFRALGEMWGGDGRRPR